MLRRIRSYIIHNISYYFKYVSKKISGTLVRFKRRSNVKLHLGCGSIDHPDFINIDGYPHSNVHFVQRIDRLKIFKKDSVDMIYASHCLEHFRYHDTQAILDEWYRVLKKGGLIRISVPDFDLLLKIYSENGRDPDLILPQLMGGQDNKFNYHYTIFNNVNLTRLLENSGFRDIETWVPDQDEYARFNDFSRFCKEVSGKMYPVSLNVQATKR